ncbi:hypothetical protein ACF0H5_013120 [Mactra antiquata]
MEKLVIVFAAAAFVLVTNASLIDVLNAVHNSPAFHNLSHADQLLIVEMVAETEAGELKQYIDQVGFHNVIALIDRLPEAEAHLFMHYLVQELQIEEHMNATQPVGKRDLAELLTAVKNNPTFLHISPANQELVIKLLTAAESNTLTALVDQIGYSSILALVDVLPEADRHLFTKYLYQHLQAEQTVG